MGIYTMNFRDFQAHRVGMNQVHQLRNDAVIPVLKPKQRQKMRSNERIRFFAVGFLGIPLAQHQTESVARVFFAVLKHRIFKLAVFLFFVVRHIVHFVAPGSQKSLFFFLRRSAFFVQKNQSRDLRKKSVFFSVANQGIRLCFFCIFFSAALVVFFSNEFHCRRPTTSTCKKIR